MRSTGVTFPSVTGRSLAGESFDLPAAFAGDLSLAIVAFQRRHWDDVATWTQLGEELERANISFVYYRVPVIDHRYRLFRPLVDGTLRVGTDDRERERTVSVYTPKEAFREALSIPSEDRVYALLLDDEGRVRWRAAGPRSDAATRELRQFVTARA
jgi:hypothetical protein